MEESLPDVLEEWHTCWANVVRRCHAHCGRVASPFAMTGWSGVWLAFFFFFLLKNFLQVAGGARPHIETFKAFGTNIESVFYIFSSSHFEYMFSLLAKETWTLVNASYRFCNNIGRKSEQCHFSFCLKSLMLDSVFHHLILFTSFHTSLNSLRTERGSSITLSPCECLSE